MGEESDEILALRSIFEDELNIEEREDGKAISITIYPATAENLASQYVCLDLTFILTKSYPKEPPMIRFLKSRGLSDTSLDELNNKMLEIVEEKKGESVLFDLLETAKDMLTSNNIPSCLCSICLSGFQNGDEFLKTECFHYFHCFCLNSYKTHLDLSDEKSLTLPVPKPRNPKSKSTATGTSAATTVPCPICRLLVSIDLKAIKEAKPPVDSHVCELDKASIKSHRERFGKIYQKQLENGCLIDLEYEQNKYLLSNIQQTYETRRASLAKEAREEESQNCETQPLSKGCEEKVSAGKLPFHKTRPPQKFHKQHMHYRANDGRQHNRKGNYKSNTQENFKHRNGHDRREKQRQISPSEMLDTRSSEFPRSRNTRGNCQVNRDTRGNENAATGHGRNCDPLRMGSSARDHRLLHQTRQNSELPIFKHSAPKEISSPTFSSVADRQVIGDSLPTTTTDGTNGYNSHKKTSRNYNRSRGRRGRGGSASGFGGASTRGRQCHDGAVAGQRRSLENQTGKSTVDRVFFSNRKNDADCTAAAGTDNNKFFRHKRPEMPQTIPVSKAAPLSGDSNKQPNQS